MSTIRTNSAAELQSRRRNLLIEHDIFLNPGEVDHNRIIRGVHRNVVSSEQYKEDMPKPILLAIDDDTSVLEAVVQDLRRHYGQDYRIVRAASGAAALDICRQLQRAQRDRRPLPLRPAHARNDRSRLPPAGAHHLSRRQTRPPDRLRRHRGRHPRHQLRQDPLLPQQALGSARGEALSGPGRPARSLEAGLQASLRRNSRRRHPLVARPITPCAISSPATASLTSG